ncbi:hypothetical protein ES703_100348 [subsurface metagenome]
MEFNLGLLIFSIVSLAGLGIGIWQACIGFGNVTIDPNKQNDRKANALFLFVISFYSISTIIVWAIEGKDYSMSLFTVFYSIFIRSFENPGVAAHITMSLSWFAEIILAALLLYFLKRKGIIR